MPNGNRFSERSAPNRESALSEHRRRHRIHRAGADAADARPRRRCAFSRSAPRAATSTRARCCSSPARRPTAAIVIQEGSFRLAAPSKPVGEVIAGPGTLLGELALIAETKRPATATAREPSTVIRISRSLFLKMLEGYPDAAHILRDQIVARAQQALAEMTDMRAMLDASSRRRNSQASICASSGTPRSGALPDSSHQMRRFARLRGRRSADG